MCDHEYDPLCGTVEELGLSLPLPSTFGDYEFVGYEYEFCRAVYESDDNDMFVEGVKPEDCPHGTPWFS